MKSCGGRFENNIKTKILMQTANNKLINAYLFVIKAQFYICNTHTNTYGTYVSTACTRVA